MPDILDCGDGTRLKPLQASNRKPADGSYDIGCAVPYGFQRLWHRHSSMSVILVRHLAGKKIHGTTTYHSSRSHMRGVPWGMHRNRITLRLFGHSRLRRIPYRHIRGEYGRLLRIRGAFGMAGRKPQNRGKEYVNRGCGMGMCGGLSTMSTLALEEFTMLHDGKAMDCAAYCCTTFIVGCLLAYVGAHVGLRFAGTEHNDGDRHAMGKEAD